MFIGNSLCLSGRSTVLRERKCAVRMSAAVPDPERRSLLRATAGVALAGLLAAVLPGATPSLALTREAAKRKEEEPKLDDQKELDKYVSGLKYEEELYENPDPAEKEIYRTKKAEKEPDYKKKEDEILKKESSVLKEEAREAAKESEVLRGEFEKH
ncbi:hypothetical protein CCYA_CCYA10G2786 [Cyanidiococcus yangmingshanensis]|uniref:Uncharacterized protein n=1 Tax=Cyanidiococcus yangmingshanensis TaxID=2690220 RepID=A0A7J7IGZ4_9RHOD|nr:hypothetical protein F1559_000756 [Cyanidiococcus yangmingshanensis]KAK4531929.1 hypothetical protein CCYA_CCYA10G2786 [Cyanidiococcus yangmingshanensis]